MKNNLTGIPKAIQKILCKVGYYLPQQFHRPNRATYIYNYFILATLVSYMILTIWDIGSVAIDGFRAYVLWLLSTITIVCTQAYKFAVGKRKETHEKNRRHINRISRKSCIFNAKIYTRPMVLEGIFIFLAIILILGIIIFTGAKNIIIARRIGYILQGMLMLLSAWNCGVLCVENFAEFYEASDIYYMKETNNL